MAAVALMASGLAFILIGTALLNPFAAVIVLGAALVLLGIDLARPGDA